MGTESEIDGMIGINGFLLKSGGSELCGMLLFSPVLDVLDVFSEQLCHKRKLGRNFFSCVCLTCDALFVFTCSLTWTSCRVCRDCFSATT